MCMSGRSMYVDAAPALPGPESPVTAATPMREISMGSSPKASSPAQHAQSIDYFAFCWHDIIFAFVFSTVVACRGIGIKSSSVHCALNNLVEIANFANCGAYICQSAGLCRNAAPERTLGRRLKQMPLTQSPQQPNEFNLFRR